MTQIAFAGVGVDFGDTTLFSNVSCTVAPGERWGIVGRNGSGKTTLFRLLTGDLEPTRGSTARAPGLRVSLLERRFTRDPTAPPRPESSAPSSRP
jgi:ATPase subunit of ABC transporter with duplicated ATPase domains